MKRHLQKFLENEAASGVLLIVTAAVALIFSNSIFSNSYFEWIHYEFLGWTLHHFVNDALMAVFFYVVGLEIKKEILEGALKDPKKSSLAIFGALGGMLIPAGIYGLTNSGSSPLEQSGWAIPMATDIAFAIGALALLGPRVPIGLKIFLLALAIIDDLGAVIVIAFFYTKKLSLTYLALSLVPFALIFLINKFKPQKFFVCTLLGVISWYLVYKSGIHATIAGVILAFLTPLKLEKSGTRPLIYWLKTLQPYVAFVIMPLFAFFNSGLLIQNISFSEITNSPVTIGIFLGLLFGKPTGIFIFCYIASMLKISKLPDGIKWIDMVGVGFIAGIGFTMSLFINHLTFLDTEFENYAKIGVLAGSVAAAIAGFIILKLSLSEKSMVEH